MYNVGSVVVHPTHGTGILKAITQMVVLGRPTNYYVFDFALNDLNKVMIPVDKAAQAGIRLPVQASVLDKALNYLSSEENLVPEARTNFHRIHKDYSERVSSGDILEVAKVYKALCIKGADKELGLKDKMLYEKTEKLLLGEIEATYHISADESRSKLRDSLRLGNE